MINSSHNPILVTGVERSGSSIVAKILEICGAFTGSTSSMNENLQLKELQDFKQDIPFKPHKIKGDHNGHERDL